MIAKKVNDLLGRDISKEDFKDLTKVVIACGVENIFDNAFSMHSNLTYC